jgi:hypothetical protein
MTTSSSDPIVMTNSNPGFPVNNELKKWVRNIILITQIIPAVSLVVNSVFFGGSFVQQRDNIAIESVVILNQIQGQRKPKSCSGDSAPLLAVKVLQRMNQAKLPLDNLILKDLNLRGAQLQNASLLGANLECADLSGANLKDAKLSDGWMNSKDIKLCNTIGFDGKPVPDTANCLEEPKKTE